MDESSKAGSEGKAVMRFDRETIERAIRERVRDMIEQVVEAELDAALGAQTSQRVGAARQGYRHGHRERTLTTSSGPTTSGERVPCQDSKAPRDLRVHSSLFAPSATDHETAAPFLRKAVPRDAYVRLQ